MPTLTTNQGLSLPATTDADNVPVSMTAYNGPNGVESRLVQRFLSIADRTARNPAPAEGELSYLADLNRYENYTGVAWVPIYPATVFAASIASYTTASVVFTTAGAALLGVTLVVPQTGQIRVDWASDLDNSLAAGFTILAPQLNLGAVIGGGAVIAAPTQDAAILSVGLDNLSTSNFYVYTGLTPGVDVNVFLNHMVTSGTGTLARRKILASQA
jgi:hypothetical protein